MDLHVFLHTDSAEIQKVIDLVTTFKNQQETHMAELDDKIALLTAEVANNTVVEKGALALIQGFSAQLAAAVEAAKNAGASPEQLQAISDLQSTLAKNDGELAAAVAANTPAAPSGGDGTVIP